jgi:hypothetical protein
MFHEALDLDMTGIDTADAYISLIGEELTGALTGGHGERAALVATPPARSQIRACVPWQQSSGADRVCRANDAQPVHEPGPVTRLAAALRPEFGQISAQFLIWR